MLVLCAIVNEEVVHQRTTERALWQHTLDSVTEDLVHSIRTLAQLCWSIEALTTWITSVTRSYRVNLPSSLTMNLSTP